MSKIISKLSINEKAQEYIFVLLGSSILALGVVLFLIPNKIVPGGTPGISILLNYFTGLPAGFLMFCVNTPLVLISLKVIDRGFAIKTILSIFTSATVVDILKEIFKVTPWTNDAMLGGIFGGIFIGTGIGLLLLGNASAGGPSIIARIISDKMKWKQKKVIIILDIIIVLIAGIIFESIESVLWSLVSVYSTAKSMDILISGGFVKKIVHISSNNIDEIINEINKKVENDNHILESVGTNSNENRRVIILIVENKDIRMIKEIVQKFDKEALMIVTEASELLGK